MKRPISLVAAVAAFMLVGVAGAAAGGGGSGAPSFTAPSGTAYDDSTVLVGFAPGTSRADEQQVVNDAQATEVETIGAGTHVLRVAAGTVARKIARLKSHSSVRYAEPNYTVYADLTPNDPRFGAGELWGLRNIGQAINGVAGTVGADISATSAWEVSTGGRSTVVAVVDTGIDYTHPDLAGNVWSAPAAFQVTIGGRTITCAAGTHGFNAIANTCDPLDDNDHGTHVSGTIGAVGNNAIGVAGVNWTASIMGAKFLSSSGSGTTAGAINAIEFTVQAKQIFGAGANVRVLSNSWGGGGFSQALLDEINKANTNNMLFVAAAGNSSANNDTTPHYPSSYSAPNVVSVAATDNRDALASFSNYGSTSVHLGAPGVDILSTIRGVGYAYYNGTSMATPHVSGAAALVLSKCTGMDTATLKSNILSNVDPISSLTGNTVTGGRLNVNKAIRACSPPTTVPAAPTSLTATGGNAQVSLSWPGSAGAASYTVKRATVNGGPYTAVATGVTTTSYTDANLTNDTTYYYVVSAVNSVGSSADSTQASATPQVTPDFLLNAAPLSVTVTRGSTAVYTVTVTPTAGFNGTVTFSVSGLPGGATAAFSSTTVTASGSTTMSVTAGRSKGTFPLTITGTSGALQRTTGVTLIVTR